MGLGGLGAAAPILSLSDINGQADTLVDVKVISQSVVGDIGLVFKPPLQATSGFLAISGSLFDPGGVRVALTKNLNIPVSDPQLVDIGKFSAHSLVQSLADAAQWVSRFADGTTLNDQLPIVHTSFGKLLNADNFFEQRIVDALEDFNGNPTFSTLDQLSARFATIAGLGPINLGFNPITNTLSFQLNLNAALPGLTDAIDFKLSLSPLASVTSTGSATIGGTASIGLNLNVGMSDSPVSVVALKAMATNGRLTGDAEFNLVIDGALVGVIVPGVATAANTTRSDFVDDLNKALIQGLRLAHLDPTLVRATLVNVAGEQRIALSSDPDRASGITLTADLGSVANLELGFGAATAQRPVIDTGANVPVNGQLTSDLTFSVFVDGVGIGTGTVTAASTTVPGHPNASQLDLINGINSALQPINNALHSAGKQITASLNTNGTLRFTATGPVGSFAIATNPADAGAHQFGLPTVQASAPLQAIQEDSFTPLDRVTVNSFSLDEQVQMFGNFNATASIGFVDVSISNARLDATARLVAGLRVPGVTLNSLSVGVDNLASLIQVTKTGAANINMPVQVTGALASLFGLPGTAAITVHSGDVFNSAAWVADFSAISAVVAFENLSADAIVAALRQVTDFLRSLERGSLLGEAVPLIDTSFASLYGLSDRFAAIVANFAADEAVSLQSLKAKLDGAIGAGLGVPGDYANFTYNPVTRDFRLTLNIAPPAHSFLTPLDLNFNDLGLGSITNLPGVGALIDVLGASPLQATATSDSHLVFGFDLTNPLAPTTYLHRETAIAFGLLVTNVAPLTMRLGGTPLQLEARNGTARLSAAVGSNAPASIRIAFDAGVDRYSFTALSPAQLTGLGASPLDVTATGAVDLTLPLFAANVSQGNLTLQSTNLQGLLGALVGNVASTSLLSVTVPNMATQISQANLLDNSFSFLAGINTFLDNLQQMLNQKNSRSDAADRRRSPEGCSAFHRRPAAGVRTAGDDRDRQYPSSPQGRRHHRAGQRPCADRPGQ